MLKRLSKQIEQLHSLQRNVEVEHAPFDDITKTFLLSHLTSPYAHNKLSDYIHTCSHIYTLKTPRASLNIIGTSDIDPAFLLHCKKIVKRVDTLHNWCDLQSNIIIWLVPTTWQRYLPEKGQEITPENINGGFTYVSSTSETKNIFVYRKEECAKVILHEVLHHSKFHISTWDDHSLRKLYEALHISQEHCLKASMQTCSTRLEPNEAIVEIWAEVFQIVFLHIEFGIPMNDLIHKEKQYNMFKTFQLLEHCASMPERVWKEKTHALSYTVIRGILLMQLDKWLTIPVPYDSKVVTEFILQNIDQFVNQVMLQKHTDGSLTKSLRMTALVGDF
jgi:hypothetical protein